MCCGGGGSSQSVKRGSGAVYPEGVGSWGRMFILSAAFDLFSVNHFLHTVYELGGKVGATFTEEGIVEGGLFGLKASTSVFLKREPMPTLGRGFSDH